ncbi:hypothetical protein WKR98_20035 [Pigmentiphaga sp. YJ18]|uniref:hypothetical protein n=1 Tax=Pigmentiphaga sp. YJ18 TaxID=3134907 RepID=UPI00310CA732
MRMAARLARFAAISHNRAGDIGRCDGMLAAVDQDQVLVIASGHGPRHQDHDVCAVNLAARFVDVFDAHSHPLGVWG